MYEAIGKVTDATVSELKEIFSDVRWEIHLAENTHHHAFRISLNVDRLVTPRSAFVQP